MNEYHIPVLLKEVLGFLSPQKGHKYIDATIGGGGHSFEILNFGGKVLGIDQDQEAIEYIEEKVKNYPFSKLKTKVKIGEELILAKGNFRDIEQIARLHGFEKVSGVLFDLGVSSHQLESEERGFSFQKEGPLDMRMDKSLEVKAMDLLQVLTKGELYELFTKLGEERFARAISDNIIRTRGLKKIETTSELADIVRRVYRGKESKIDPATRVFQALRIAVNDELNAISQALPKALELLENEGKILVISFHSLEDRIVKQVFNDFEDKGLGRMLTKKPIIAGENEISQNPRSRSAKLRVFEKN